MATTKKATTIRAAREGLAAKAAQRTAAKTNKPKGGLTKAQATARAHKATQAVRKPSVKSTAKMATRTATPPPPVDMNFREGSDSAVIWEEILKGGGSRKEVLNRLAAHFANVTTRGGKPKPISTVMNYLIRRAIQTGKYQVVSSWAVVPIVGDEAPAKTPKPSASALASTKVAKVAVNAEGKKAAKKVAAKKTASKKPAVTKKPSATTTPKKAVAKR